MRIRTSGESEWRLELYDVGALLNENTRSGAIDGACLFTREILRNLEQAVEHPNMTEDLADMLSTAGVEVSYEIKRDVSVK